MDEVDDETVLAEVSRILSAESETDILDELTDEQLAGIEKARAEVRAGKHNTLDEHKQKTAQWLSARK